MYSNQETFDRVVAHARKQQAKSITDNIGCSYRGPEGLMCFAGCLIPNEDYVPQMESLRASRGIVENCLTNLGYSPVLVEQLQMIHDRNEPEMWEDKFREFAANYQLVYVPPVSHEATASL